MFGDLMEGPPFHTDEHGNQFWPEKSLCLYAIEKGCPEIQAMIVKRPDGTIKRLLVRDGNVYHEGTSYEDSVVQIDFAWMDKNVPGKDAKRPKIEDLVPVRNRPRKKARKDD
jgi:hypothetical protein